MNIFNYINKVREENKFPSKEYKTFLKKEVGKNSVLDKNTIKLEINTNKFYLLKIRTYINKNLRIINSCIRNSDPEENKFLGVYKEYCTCLLTKEGFLELRKKLQLYPQFVQEIDKNLEQLNYDVNILKYKYLWNDIELLFNTEEKVREFVDRRLAVSDNKYNSMLVKYIYKLESKVDQLRNLIMKDKSRVYCIRGKLISLNKHLNDFMNFLTENYVESQHLERLKKDIQEVYTYYDNLYSISILAPNTVRISENDSNFVEQSSCNGAEFDEVTPNFVINKNNLLLKGIDDYLIDKIVIDKKKGRKFILEQLEAYFKLDNRSVPFIPDFYDIAYDYIKYPSTDRSINEMLEKMNILNK